MEVRTSHVTLGNLGLDHSPRAVTEHSTDLVGFVPADVVELQTHRVTFTAIHTRMGREIGKQPQLLCFENSFVPQ
jgi:hypothetical protein